MQFLRFLGVKEQVINVQISWLVMADKEPFPHFPLVSCNLPRDLRNVLRLDIESSFRFFLLKKGI